MKRILKAAEELRDCGWDPVVLLELMSYMEALYGWQSPDGKLEALRSSPLAIFTPRILVELLCLRLTGSRVYDSPPPRERDGVLYYVPAPVQKRAAKPTEPNPDAAEAKERLARYADAIRSPKTSRADDPARALLAGAEKSVAAFREAGKSAKEAWALTAKTLEWRGEKEPGGGGVSLRKWCYRMRKAKKTPGEFMADPATPLIVDFWIDQLSCWDIDPPLGHSGDPGLSYGKTTHGLAPTNSDRLEQEGGGNAEQTNGKEGKKHGSIPDDRRGSGGAPCRTADDATLEASGRGTEVHQAEPSSVSLLRGFAQPVHDGERVQLNRRGDGTPRARHRRLKEPP